MAVSDWDQLQEIAWRVVETDDALTSGLWTREEVGHYFTQRQNRFNRDTKLMLAHQPIGFAANNPTANLPVDWIASLNGSWTPDDSQEATTVAPGDRYAAEKGFSSTYNQPSRPVIMDDQGGGTRTIEIYPAPTVNGVLDLLYACVLEELPLIEGTDTNFTIPDDFVPYVIYGALSDMLSKEGRGRSPELAAYCQARYQEGVALAAVLLEGYF